MFLSNFISRHWIFFGVVLVIVLFSWEGMILPYLKATFGPWFTAAKKTEEVVEVVAQSALDEAEKAWQTVVAYQLRNGTPEALTKAISLAHDLKETSEKETN